jgi:N12 class adenine-specific DNA methylase
MGRRSLSQTAAATNWLPGFEPDSGDDAQGATAQPLTQSFAAAPPSPRSAVRIAAVMATVDVPSTSDPIEMPPTRPTLEVLGTEDIQMDATSDEPDFVSMLSDLEEKPPAKFWPVFDASRYAPPAGENARIQANLRAIELTKQLTESGTTPDDEQRHELLRYAGWGGLARIFEDLDKNPHKALRAKLEAMLTEDEFASARSTVTDAFYTDPVLVGAMWAAIKRFGFRGGKVIEPTAGTGLFIAGMPEELAVNSEITVVEKDVVSGAILRAALSGLDVNTHVCGIERAPVPYNFYDVAISNCPFGDFTVPETRKVGYATWSIHNYMAAKFMDLVRPGGIVALVTSRHTLDAGSETQRKWLETHGELLGAIRLPRGAFRRHAGTDVVADMLFLRKRERPVYSVDSNADWLKVSQAPRDMLKPVPDSALTYYAHGGYHEHQRPINGYFAKRPGMVLGQLVKESGQYGAVSFLPVFDGTEAEFADRLRQATQSLPEDVYSEPRAQEADGFGGVGVTLQRVGATQTTKIGSFVVHDGRIHLSEGATWVDVNEGYTGKARGRVLAMIKVRDAARKLLEQQARSQDEAEFKSLQFALNTVYDSFVTQYGNVHDRANLRLFRSDPECPLLLSLETYNEDKERFDKAAIFSRRTVGHREPPATATDTREAMMISLAVHGRIVLADMAKRQGVTARTVVKNLESEGLAYIDPEDGNWKPADEYLSGHIRDKIATAKAAGKKFERNELALESVLPADLGPADVEVRLGAPWVPGDVIKDFAVQLVKADPQRMKVSYDAGSATWSVRGDYKNEYAGDRTLNCTTWGTADRCAVDLLEAALNQQPPKITRTDADGKSYVDKKATLAAREKFEAIRQQFRKWAYADDARRDRLLRIYNDEFNQVRTRQYDGEHLLLPGMSGVIVPYKHQLDAIWRIVTGGNTLLAHIVGAGKTFTMAAACMEMRRLGKASKPIIAVPNNLLAQATGDFVRFYPNANVLMASKEDFEGDKRKEFCARIATGDWDAVIMTHSTFERLPMRPETVDRFLKDMTDQARLALDLATDSSAKRTVKQCEKLIKTFEAKLERATAASEKDDCVYFDDLGVDALCIDECHFYKNLMRISKMPQIAGLPNVASNRAFDMWVKTSVLMEKRGGKEEGIVMASATPISNSICEAHVMMKYLIPSTLKRMGLYEFDAWAATFGESQTGMEVSPDGSGYRLNTRFSRFVNTPELMAVFRLCADIQTRSMINLPVPDVKGGKPRTIMSEPSPELKEYTETLVQRADRIRSGQVKPNEDNMLAVTNAGRKAALDMRLIAPGLPFDETGKLADVHREVLRIWSETTERKGTQIVFCDLSTPTTAGFSVYNELRKRLEQSGIPREEIEFIHDHDSDTAKDRLFQMVRAGKVRVMFGSTQKLGTGTNAQRLIKAIHQVDMPWRSSDVEQRDGRGLRPGNQWEEIELLRYVTKGSFDAYQAQTLEVKARFIDQLFSSAPGMRTVEDVSMGALTYAEIKAIASGNPLVLEKATIDAEVVKLNSLMSSFEDARWQLGMRRSSLVSAITTIEGNRASDALDQLELQQQRDAGWSFKAFHRLSEATRAATELKVRIGTHVRDLSRQMDVMQREPGWECAGWVLQLHKRSLGLEMAWVSRRTGQQFAIDRGDVAVYERAETGALILDKLESLCGLAEMQTQRCKTLKTQLEEVERELCKEFEHAARLDELVRRQREIETLLDLDKDEAGTETAKESEGREVPVAEEA